MYLTHVKLAHVSPTLSNTVVVMQLAASAILYNNLPVLYLKLASNPHHPHHHSSLPLLLPFPPTHPSHTTPPPPPNKQTTKNGPLLLFPLTTTTPITITTPTPHNPTRLLLLLLPLQRLHRPRPNRARALLGGAGRLLRLPGAARHRGRDQGARAGRERLRG